MITRRTWLCVVALAASLIGCEDEFLTGASITRMRLLGAKVGVFGEPERASVRPGDSVRVELSLALPDYASDDPRRVNPMMSLDPLFPKDPMSDVRSMLLTCTKADIGTGQPQCAEVLYLFQLFTRYQNGEFADAGTPDGGMPPPPVSQEDIDATFAALRAGVGCDDPAPNPGEPSPLELASLALSNVPVTSQPANLACKRKTRNEDPLVTTFDLNADYVGADRLVQGVICEYGEPVFKLEPPFFDCRYEVGSNPNLPNRAPTAEVFFYTINVERDGESNAHPSFAINDPIAIANFSDSAPKPMPRAWLDEPPAPAPVLVADPNGGPDKLVYCSDVTDPTRIRDYGRKSTITLGVGDNREEISAMPLRREVFQVEAFSTFGELDRQFSVVDDLDPLVADGTDGDKAVVELEWEHGKLPVPARNTLVRFHFLIRDGRGGFEQQSRWMCLCRGGSCQ